MTLTLTVTFEKGVESVTLPAPEPGSQMRLVKHQGLGLTAGGTRYAYDKGVTRYEADLSFRSLTTAQKEALTGFFDDDTEGSKETFTYTDTEATAYTARLLAPTLSVVKVAAGVWDVAATLELSAMGE